MSNTILVRTKLADDEWRRIKSAAALKGVTVTDFVTDTLRAVLKGAKP